MKALTLATLVLRVRRVTWLEIVRAGRPRIDCEDALLASIHL